jgi:hypothetical protein
MQSQSKNIGVQGTELVAFTTARFVIPVSDIYLIIQDSIKNLADTFKKQNSKSNCSIQRYVKTANAAEYINVDESFLNKRKGKIFKLGKHFFKPIGQSIVRWDIEALEQWITAQGNDTFIDDEVAELLERR